MLNLKCELEGRTDPVPARGNEPWPPPDLGGNYGHFFFLTFCASAFRGGALEKFLGGPCVSAFKGGALENMFMSPSKGEMLVKNAVGLLSHTAVDWQGRLPLPRGVPPPEM